MLSHDSRECVVVAQRDLAGKYLEQVPAVAKLEQHSVLRRAVLHAVATDDIRVVTQPDGGSETSSGRQRCEYIMAVTSTSFGTTRRKASSDEDDEREMKVAGQGKVL